MHPLHEKIENYIKEKQQTKKKSYNPVEWLNSAAKRAPQIYLGTHMIKYTHCEAKGTRGLLVVPGDSCEEVKQYYLSTSTLTNQKLDFEGNAAALDVAGFLLLEDNGKTLLKMIQEGDSSALSAFTEDHEQLHLWIQGFRSVFTSSNPESHTLAKQVYFPVSEEEYHLISPIFSSSMQQAIYDRVEEYRYNDKYKEARKLKSNRAFSETIIVSLPNLLTLSFGGSKPQNISYRNSSRKGKCYLLSCQPPIWKTSKQQVLNHKDSFWKHFSWVTKEIIQKFKGFLLSLSSEDNNVYIREMRANYILELVDLLIQTIANIQQQSEGWSRTSSLPLYEKYCLDPRNSDSEFQTNRERESWREEMANAFSRWLKSKLNYKKINLGDEEFTYFRKVCLDSLKELN